MGAGEHGPSRAAPPTQRARSGVLRLSRPVHRRANAGIGRVGDRPDAIPGTRARPRQSRRPRWACALRHHGRRARPDPQPEDAAAARARRLRPPLPRDGRRRGRDRRARPGAEVSRPRRRRPHVRPGLHARAGLAPAPGYLRRGGPALRAARLPRLLLRRVAARRKGDSGKEHAGAGGPLGTRHLRRSPDRPRPRDRAGRPAARTARPHGAGALAPQGAESGRRDPERAPRELSRRDARAARRARRGRCLGRMEGETRGGLPSPGRRDAGGRAASPQYGRPCGSLRRTRGAGGAAGPPRAGASVSCLGSTRR